MKKPFLLAGILSLMAALTNTSYVAGESPSLTNSSVTQSQYVGQKVSLDFQAANIKSVFRLASLGGKRHQHRCR